MTAAASLVLARDLADFLIQLSIAMHKHAMYPAGHPMMRNAAEDLALQLDALLVTKDKLSLGVARHQLLVEGVATDERNALLRDVALRLSRHQLAGIEFKRDITVEELADFLHAAKDPDVAGHVLGRNPPSGAKAWKYIVLHPLKVDHLDLADDDTDAGADRAVAVSQLWLRLARAALGSEMPTAEAEAAEPLVVAEAIDRKARDASYAQLVTGYLSQIAEELKDRPSGEALSVARRVSRLVVGLKKETAQHLLKMIGGGAERQRFMLSASQGFRADAVVKLVEAAHAGGMAGNVSHSMLRLLAKLARHAEVSGSAQSDSALREQVQSLIADWQLADPNPAGYRLVLDTIAHSAGPENAETTGALENAERVVSMALEMGVTGPLVESAAVRMLDRRVSGRLLELLGSEAVGALSPDAALAIWRMVATEQRLRGLLTSDKPDLRLVERMIGVMGMDSADPLLDALQVAKDRSTRARLLDLLLLLGEAVGRPAVERLAGAPWYVQRNLIVLLGRLPSMPDRFDLTPYGRANDARVRREAAKLLMRASGTRESTIVTALSDADPRIVHMAVAAAAEMCPPSAAVALTALLEKPIEPATKALAVRAIGSLGLADSRALLLRLVAPRRTLFGRPRLAPASPVRAAALTALERWKDHKDVARVLRQARAEGLIAADGVGSTQTKVARGARQQGGSR